MLELYISLGSFFKCTLWQCCAHNLVKFRLKKHLVIVWKNVCLGLKYLFCCHKYA